MEDHLRTLQKAGYFVEKSNSVLDQAIRDRLCVLAHDLNNALSVIAGHCELMAEHAEPDSECEKRLHQILTIVHKMAKRINGHECRIVSPVAQSTIHLDNLRTPVTNSETPTSTRNRQSNALTKAK
jgi:signal transduction histidine kinase